MFKRFIIILLLLAVFIACKRKHNLNGVYHVYKVINGKDTDPEADAMLKQKYLNKPFIIAFNTRAVSLSSAAEPKPTVLHKINSRNDMVWYTPGGYDGFYHDTSPVEIELRTTSSDTALFIADKLLFSAKSVSIGKKGGMIICYLTKTDR